VEEQLDTFDIISASIPGQVNDGADAFSLAVPLIIVHHLPQSRSWHDNSSGKPSRGAPPAAQTNCRSSPVLPVTISKQSNDQPSANLPEAMPLIARGLIE